VSAALITGIRLAATPAATTTLTAALTTQVRLAATAQFNKARGFHQVDLDADLVRALLEQGLTEEQVSEQLGLELEAVHRYKQLTGIAELFARADWSMAWEMVDEVTT
jgi:hypothetical protein